MRHMCENWIKTWRLFLSVSSQLICRLAVGEMSWFFAPLLFFLCLFFIFWSSNDTFWARRLVRNCIFINIRTKSIFTLYAVCWTITDVRIFQKHSTACAFLVSLLSLYTFFMSYTYDLLWLIFSQHWISSICGISNSFFNECWVIVFRCISVISERNLNKCCEINAVCSLSSSLPNYHYVKKQLKYLVIVMSVKCSKKIKEGERQRR